MVDETNEASLGLTGDLTQSLDNLTVQQQKLAIQQELLLKKALESDDVDAIFKARDFIKQSVPQNKKVKGLQNKDEVPIKSLLVDPLDLNNSLGYKHKSFAISYDILRAMARTHVVKSIIETRKTQISAYCQPQVDRYSPGFVVQPKKRYTQLNSNSPLTDSQKKKIDFLVEFLMQGGTVDNYWDCDSFDVFVGKLVTDSLTLDQACMEIVRDNGGLPCEFKAVDGGTIRKIDTFADDYESVYEPIKGYYPTLVQVINSEVVNEYYPWEMMLGIRNPSTDIKSNGYGRSELEDMVQTVTALLNADYYNANFFKVGSAPKGILKYKGDINMNTVEQFRSQWVANTAGVLNMHKIPLINAENLDFVNLQQSNKDMEFAKFQEFLIKISCAIYKIDPSEIGFPMAGAAAQPSFGGSVGNAEKLKYSKDKGLKPLLKYIERWINKYIIYQIDPNYEFRFVGLDDATTYQEELDNNIKEVQNFKTLNEIRKSHGLEPIEGGDMVLNPIAYQNYMYLQQQAQQAGAVAEENPFNAIFGGEGDEHGDPRDEQSALDDEENPFAKSLSEELAAILGQDYSQN